MKLNELVNQYIQYRKSLGEKFRTNETYLKAFCRALDPSITVEVITEEMINHFLYGDSQAITSGWFVKHTALLGFYQYALTRHYVAEIPLPRILPKRPQPFVPYIYSRNELKRLFDTALAYQKNKSHIPPHMAQAVLVLTYSFGLRLHETVSITLGDIDLCNSVLTIQQSKFYKSRLLPFNQQIKAFIKSYLQRRIQHGQPISSGSHLFMGLNNQPFNAGTMRSIFQRIRQKAGIKRSDDANFQPRIHDLRHTFAVNRLTSWYQENKNVQQLLPILSVYLGHTHLAHTTVYLTMTNDLLQQASLRFEKYAAGEQK